MVATMKTLGDPIFARNPDGALKSRIGTLFFRTPGLVTQRGVHAMQRIAWVKELNRERAAEGRPALTEREAAAEWADSADLLFTDDCVLIRPDPDRMDLAFKADEVLQTLVSKRRIRFLNTHAAKVRDALRARGENWRMARPPQNPEEIGRALEMAHVAIQHEPVYYYNGNTGTRYLTVGGLERTMALPPDAFRAQVAEITEGLRGHNRLGQPEIALFPADLVSDVREAFNAVLSGGINLGQSPLYALAHIQYNHLAKRKHAPEGEGVNDDATINPMLGARFEVGRVACTAQAGAVLQMQRCRADDRWLTPAGFVADLKARWRWLEVEEALFAGKDLFPLYERFGSELNLGDPYYRSSFYSRTDVRGHLFSNALVDVSALLTFHATDRITGFWQQVSCRFYIGGTGKRVNRPDAAINPIF